MKRNFTTLATACAPVNYSAKKAIVALVFSFLLSNFISAQQNVALFKETFPTVSNTGFVTPISAIVTGSTGTWNMYSTSGQSTLGTFPAYYSAVTNALKLTVWSTAGVAATDAFATSPTFNLANAGCNWKYWMSFKLYTYNCIQNDHNAWLTMEFSRDGGATWVEQWRKTSGQMYATWGASGLTTIQLAIPYSSTNPTNSFLTANFKYRFRAHSNANNVNNFYTFVDDATIYAEACTGTPLNLGDLVWLDANKNGIKEASENGIANITVRICRDNDNDGVNDFNFTPYTTTTNASGNYQFTNLAPGRYCVQLINLPITLRLVAVNAGAPDEDVDNNNNGLLQDATYTICEGGWVTLLPGSEPTNDGDGNNGNLTYDFALAPASALSVQSLELTALMQNDIVAIKWTTYNEIDITHFELQRSINGIDFTAFTVTPATGIRSNTSYYNNTDAEVGNLNADVVYYRIKAIEKNGKTYLSNVVAVKTGNAATVSVWPNPFVNKVVVNYPATAAGTITIKILDNVGKVMLSQDSRIAKGANQVNVENLAKLPAGMYWCHIVKNGETVAVSKLMK
jgi:hypothetical protein